MDSFKAGSGKENTFPDSGVWEELYRSLNSKLFACALAILGNRQEAEDVVQSLFTRVLPQAEILRQGQSRAAYLLRSARNLALDRLKMARREKNRVLRKGKEIYLTTVPGALDGLIREEDLRQLQEYYERLETEEREVVALHLFEGLSFQDLAEYMNLSVHSARYKYEKAIQRLREFFNEME